MTARELELKRLHEASATIADDTRMLYVCLTGADPKEGHRLRYEPFDDIGRQIPAPFKGTAQALYKIAATELDKLSSQRLCLAIETYLGTVMSKDELETFKEKMPMRFPIKKYINILEELEKEGFNAASTNDGTKPG